MMAVMWWSSSSTLVKHEYNNVKFWVHHWKEIARQHNHIALRRKVKCVHILLLLLSFGRIFPKWRKRVCVPQEKKILFSPFSLSLGPSSQQSPVDISLYPSFQSISMQKMQNHLFTVHSAGLWYHSSTRFVKSRWVRKRPKSRNWLGTFYCHLGSITKITQPEFLFHFGRSIFGELTMDKSNYLCTCPTKNVQFNVNQIWVYIYFSPVYLFIACPHFLLSSKWNWPIIGEQ